MNTAPAPAIPPPFGDPERAVQVLNGASWRGLELAFLPPTLLPPYGTLNRGFSYAWGLGPDIASPADRRDFERCEVSLLNKRETRRGRDGRREFEARGRAALQGHLDTWLTAGRDWARWAADNKDAAGALGRKVSRLVFHLGAVGVSTTHGPRPVLSPCLQAGVGMDFESPEARIAAFSALFFLGVILSPDGVRVGRCDRCERYYFSSQRRGNKKYCSEACNNRAGAERNTRPVRLEARAAKIRSAQKILDAAGAGGVPDWRDRVVRCAAPRLGLTRGFLTRAANRGELRLPGARHGGPHEEKESPPSR